MKKRFRSLGELIVFAAVAVGGFVSASRATEQGGSDYLLGYMDIMSGVMPKPGLVIRNDLYAYHGRASKTVMNGRVNLALNQNLTIDIFSVTQMTEVKILGSNYGWNVLLPGARADMNGTVDPSHIGNGVGAQGAQSGVGDLSITPIMLGWDFGDFHIRPSFTFYAPTGQYNTDRVINIGRNVWSFQPQAGITYFNKKWGREVSASLGYNWNTENTDTHYTSGEEFHADYRVAQFLRCGLSLGLGGYYYKQTTSDSGSGAFLGAFKGEAAAIGPQVSYTLEKDEKKSVNLLFKYYNEYQTIHRFQGDSLWFTGIVTF